MSRYAWQTVWVFVTSCVCSDICFTFHIWFFCCFSQLFKTLVEPVTPEDLLEECFLLPEAIHYPHERMPQTVHLISLLRRNRNLKEWFPAKWYKWILQNIIGAWKEEKAFHYCLVCWENNPGARFFLVILKLFLNASQSLKDQAIPSKRWS